jgi:DNA-binding NarL/FixJ family response regulator
VGTTVAHPVISLRGLAEVIQTVETSERILRSLADVSRRVGGQSAEALCYTAIHDAERRLGVLRGLAARAQERASTPSPVAVVPSAESRTPLSPLSPREWEVAELVARGFTNQQIAFELVLTPGTVANHVAHILTKLDLQSRTQIAVWVIHQRERAS